MHNRGIYRRRAVRVYGMGRVRCGCAVCEGAFVWVIQYKKGEYTYENDFGEPHPHYVKHTM